jgi:V/A-type H+-transporting ATPase subunit C
LAYTVIRSHALIAELLKPEQIQDLAKSGSIEVFIEWLSSTQYGEIKVEGSGDPSIALEKVFYVKFIDRMSQIVDIAPQRIGKFLQAYYYLRFEVQNLKRILRGKFSELPVSQVKEYLIPIEPYHVTSYEDIIEADSLDEAVGLLQGTHYSQIGGSLDYCRENEVIWPLEQALNHIYAMSVLESLETLSRQDRTLVRNILKFEVNVENLLNAIKQRRTSGEREAQNLEELFPVTFDIDLEKIEALIEAEDLRAAIDDLGSPYSEVLTPIYEGDVALIRARVRRYIYTIVRNARSMNDFGLNVILAYLIFSELEKDDLVGIAWGLTQRIPATEMTKYLAVSK